MRRQPGREGLLRKGQENAGHCPLVVGCGGMGSTIAASQAAHEALAFDLIGGEPPVGLDPHCIGRIRDGGSGVT